MAVEGGERTSLRWCLTIARCMAAAVVAALAGVVVLLVLSTGLHPESISLSVTHGHIQAAQVLWSKRELFLSHYRRYHDRNLTMYEAARSLDFWVSMNVLQRGGAGATKNCTITTVGVFDMPNAPSFLGMVKINTLQVNKDVCQDPHHHHPGALDRWITINNQSTLDYIAQTYGGMNEFTAMLQVNMTIINTSGKEESTSHYCWPVTIGHSRSTTAEAITCKPSNNINYAADAGWLAPPPPPPLSPPPPPPLEIIW
ncbi:unnamed protein product [Urochloa decumbens]|uniref:Uncharacterized protein n=1 Tax=Urochloa decumbens TaxID=240449 RepID=A0ABC9D8D0_9POAL